MTVHSFNYTSSPAIEIPVDLAHSSIVYDLPYVDAEVHRKAKMEGKQVRIINVSVNMVVFLRQFEGPLPRDFLEIQYQTSDGALQRIGAWNFQTGRTFAQDTDIMSLFGSSNFGINVFKIQLYGNTNNSSRRIYQAVLWFRGTYEVLS